MTSKDVLLGMVKKANKDQLWHMIYDFGMIGFYREDKRVQRQFIIDCINNCYTTALVVYDELPDSDCLLMEKAVIRAMKM